LSQNPILKALSSIQKSGARTLLMGGQACIFYGAAEFSRDLDLLIPADATNLPNLERALEALNAEVIAVPPFEERHLLRGHAVHLRCRAEDVAGLRIDLMSRLRGVAGFEELWARRSTIEVAGQPVDLLAMEDLVRAKKTQRDKDWPMIRRLVEQNYFGRSGGGTKEQVQFWLRELRTPELLVEVAGAHAELARAEAAFRPAVQAARLARPDDVREALEIEEREERRKDREYWAPLRRELEEFRLRRRRK
jgi:hypothetical protein